MPLTLNSFIPENYLEKLDELHVTTGNILTRIINQGFPGIKASFNFGTRQPDSGLFNVGGKVYVLSDNFEESPHRYGDGGERVRITKLESSKNPLIVSIHFEAYETYSDDSTDFVKQRIKRTYLIQEDAFARRIFDLIK